MTVGSVVNRLWRRKLWRVPQMQGHFKIELKDQTQITKLVTEVVLLGGMAPRPAKECFIGKGAQQAEMTLSGVMNAGQQSVDDYASK